jgi:hypothetical protein
MAKGRVEDHGTHPITRLALESMTAGRAIRPQFPEAAENPARPVVWTAAPDSSPEHRRNGSEAPGQGHRSEGR